jgi:hypothetical protein
MLIGIPSRISKKPIMTKKNLIKKPILAKKDIILPKKDIFNKKFSITIQNSPVLGFTICPKKASLRSDKTKYLNPKNLLTIT